VRARDWVKADQTRNSRPNAWWETAGQDNIHAQQPQPQPPPRPPHTLARCSAPLLLSTPLWSPSAGAMSTRHHPTVRSEKRASTSAQSSSSRPRHPSSGAMGGEHERRGAATTAGAQPHPRKQAVPSVGERRTEKKETLTREAVSVRTRSPLKHQSESRVNARSRAEKATRTTDRAAERGAVTTGHSSETPGEFSFVLESQCHPIGLSVRASIAITVYPLTQAYHLQLHGSLKLPSSRTRQRLWRPVYPSLRSLRRLPPRYSPNR
jgi:hypothetical protein